MKKNIIIATVLAFFAGFGLGYNFIKSKIAPAIKEVMNEFIDEMIDEVYPCRLMVTVYYDKGEESHVVDMSKYNEKGIINLIVYKKDAAKTEEEELLNGKTLIYSPAVVYNVGGHWFWKIL